MPSRPPHRRPQDVRALGRPGLVAIAAALAVLVVVPAAVAVAARSVEAGLVGQLRQGEVAFQLGRQQLSDGYRKQD
jgi:hypothetical protein